MANFSSIYAAELNITIYRGDTQSISVTFTDPNDGDGALDLSAYSTLLMQIKQTSSSASLLDLSLGSGLTVSGASNNVLTIDLTSAQASLSAGTYKYDIEGITADPITRTIMQGNFIVSQDITNA